MATMVNVSKALRLATSAKTHQFPSLLLLPNHFTCSSNLPFKFPSQPNTPQAFLSTRSIDNFGSKNGIACLAVEKNKEQVDAIEEIGEFKDNGLIGLENETLLYSFSPLPLLLLGALPGADTVRSLFGPFVELIQSWNLPDWLVHWGHPGNMAVVLFVMGGYGTYLGFRIRFSDDVEEKAKAKDLHPKLLGGMFFFFALGATGGVTSLFLRELRLC